MIRAWAGALLELRSVSVRLGAHPALTDVSLVVEPRSWTAVVGPNGAGKSTLLRTLAGLQRHQGQVLLDGRDVSQLDPRERATEIAYTPQVPTLPDTASVRDYVLLGRTPHRSLLARPTREDREEVERLLDRLDLAGLAARRVGTLSGGERQRAVLARALAQRPRLLLLDEPTSALDLGHAQQTLELVDQLRREQGLTVLSSLHDLALAGQYAERLVLLRGGRTVESGTPEQVLTAQTLAEHYGALAEVTAGPAGVQVHPVRPGVVALPPR